MIYIALGANIPSPAGPPAVTLKRALAAMAKHGIEVVAVSRFYRAPAWPKGDQPDFVNAVARLDTGLSPAQLLAGLHRIEALHGRDRPYINAPRTLDLDLLLFGPEMIFTPELTVPHPRMHERAFVLRPLLEIDPDATVPGRGRADALLETCTEQIVDRVG